MSTFAPVNVSQQLTTLAANNNVVFTADAVNSTFQDQFGNIAVLAPKKNKRALITPKLRTQKPVSIDMWKARGPMVTDFKETMATYGITWRSNLAAFAYDGFSTLDAQTQANLSAYPVSGSRVGKIDYDIDIYLPGSRIGIVGEPKDNPSKYFVTNDPEITAVAPPPGKAIVLMTTENPYVMLSQYFPNLDTQAQNYNILLADMASQLSIPSKDLINGTTNQIQNDLASWTPNSYGSAYTYQFGTVPEFMKVVERNLQSVFHVGVFDMEKHCECNEKGRWRISPDVLEEDYFYVANKTTGTQLFTSIFYFADLTKHIQNVDWDATGATVRPQENSEFLLFDITPNDDLRAAAYDYSLTDVGNSKGLYKIMGLIDKAVANNSNDLIRFLESRTQASMFVDINRMCFKMKFDHPGRNEQLRYLVQQNQNLVRYV